jgi:hypothetical protein
MADFVINQEVDGMKRHFVTAEAYDVEGEFIHFVDEDGDRVMSIHKNNVRLIERQ